jgi:hypothetical protein
MLDATTAGVRPLLPEWFALLAGHRPAFQQARPFYRSEALGVGWLCAFGRHTITQTLLALGAGGADWSGWYRLFSVPRLSAERLTSALLAQTLPLAPPDQPYVAVVDGLQVPRASRTMPGTSWLKHPATPVFKPGIHRAQRFVDLAWLPTATATGFSRAVPLRLEPAFPPKAVPAPDHAPRREWEAGLAGLAWLRSQLDAAGRTDQALLALGDGSYSNAGTWAGLPERTTLLARCPRNRALFRLPPPYAGRGRPRRYGERAPRPDAWLARAAGWQRAALTVRGRAIPLTFRVAGPYLVKGAPARPLFLLVVRGSDPRHGKRRREPAFWLVSAVARGGRWRLPARPQELLAWAWQRWEVEVAHRELKTGFGLGEPQCWSPTAAVLTVQWAAALYATALLAGLRAWGLGRGPHAPPGAWWAGAGRWSLGTLWQGLRQELWRDGDFRRVWAGTAPDPAEITDWAAAKTNAVLAARR